MPRLRRTLPLVALSLFAVFVSSAWAAPSAGDEDDFGHNVVRTDGHLRPGHLERIWVKGFPGAGQTEVTFFPTAICEMACGALGRVGGKTNRNGEGHFRVRVPNGFLGSRNKFTPFRNRERIDVNVQWIGQGVDEFDVGTAEPYPVIVRIHHRR